MVDLPDDHQDWMDIANLDELHEVPTQLAGNPYFLEGAPTAPSTLSEEEDPSEDEVDDKPEEVTESDDEGILQHA